MVCPITRGDHATIISEYSRRNEADMTMIYILYTEFLCASALHDERAGRVEAAASQEVTELEPVDETVTTVPEVEQVEHLAYVCTHPHTHTHTHGS